MEQNYCVYWISNSNSSYLDSGYIGITTNFAFRMSTHKRKSVSSNFILSKAILKYGWDSLNKVILVDNIDRELAMLIEQELRPTSFIGWNMAAGGGVSTFISGSKHTELSLNKMRNRKFSKEHKEKLKIQKVNKNIGVNSLSFKGVIIATNIITKETVKLIGDKDMRDKGFTPQNVYRCLSGARNKHKNHTFERLNYDH